MKLKFKGEDGRNHVAQSSEDFMKIFQTEVSLFLTPLSKYFFCAFSYFAFDTLKYFRQETEMILSNIILLISVKKVLNDVN